MANMTYRDIPVLRSYGFEYSPYGDAWYKKGNDGVEYQVVDATTLLTFNGKHMSRESFDELFK